MTTATTIDLHGRSFLKLLDFNPDEIRYLLDLAAELKAAKTAGTEVERLRKKEICLIFEKTSTRTRCAFEVAAYDQGAHVTYLDPVSSQMGHKETVKDTARVLGRFYDGIEYRGFDQDLVQILADFAGVPVWNGLTDEYHPTQILADILTMREHSGEAAHGDLVRVPGRRAQQHGQLAHGRRRAAGHGRAAGRPRRTAGRTRSSSRSAARSPRRRGRGSP